MVKAKTDCLVKTTPSNDPRSYRLSSRKLNGLGFVQQQTVEHVVDELIEACRTGAVERGIESFTEADAVLD